jgi:hypothetical protein
MISVALSFDSRQVKVKERYTLLSGRLSGKVS